MGKEDRPRCPAPLVIYVRLVLVDVQPRAGDAPGGLITGTPCSNGIAEGEVLVIDSPQTAENAKDRILVTKMTDPGWVFLITMAKGIIAEKGSLLSHTAIISRELGVPSIVGVKKATGILRTGDTVRMNGGTGSIEVVSGHGG